MARANVSGYISLSPVRLCRDFGSHYHRHHAQLDQWRADSSNPVRDGCCERKIGKTTASSDLVGPVHDLERRNSLWALEPDKALQRLPTAFALLLLYAVAVSFRMTRKEFNGVVVLTILGGLTAATFSFHQFLNTGGSLRSSLAMAGRETDPNQFAASLLLPLSLAMGAFFTSRGWLNRLSATAALALIGFGILLSMSRGSALAVAVMIGVYLYRGGMNRRTILPIAVIALLLLAVPSLFFVRIQQGAADKGEGRLDIWQVGLVAVEHNGVFGAGLDSFPALYQEYAANAPIFRGYRRGPHNIYLGITAEMGIIGLLLFLAAVRSQLRSARPAGPQSQIFSSRLSHARPLLMGC